MALDFIILNMGKIIGWLFLLLVIIIFVWIAPNYFSNLWSTVQADVKNQVFLLKDQTVTRIWTFILKWWNKIKFIILGSLMSYQGIAQPVLKLPQGFVVVPYSGFNTVGVAGASSQGHGNQVVQGGGPNVYRRGDVIDGNTGIIIGGPHWGMGNQFFLGTLFNKPNQMDFTTCLANLCRGSLGYPEVGFFNAVWAPLTDPILSATYAKQNTILGYVGWKDLLDFTSWPLPATPSDMKKWWNADPSMYFAPSEIPGSGSYYGHAVWYPMPSYQVTPNNWPEQPINPSNPLAMITGGYGTIGPPWVVNSLPDDYRCFIIENIWTVLPKSKPAPFNYHPDSPLVPLQNRNLI